MASLFYLEVTVVSKVLCFEGAGWSGADSSKATVGNCRIRTAFHTEDEKMVYCELSCYEIGRTPKGAVAYYQGHIDHLFNITDEVPNDDESRHSLLMSPREEEMRVNDQSYSDFKGKRLSRFVEYTQTGILQFVNSLGGKFDEIRVLPDYGGYKVFRNDPKAKGSAKYNFGDQFEVSDELIRCRREVAQYIYDLEKREGKEFPNFNAWVDDEEPTLFHILRSFPGRNKHWIVELQEGNTLDQSLSTMRETPLGKWGC